MALPRSLSLEAELHVLSEKSDQKEPPSFGTKLRLVFSNITIEPVMCMYILPSVMAYLASQNLNLEKACRVNMGYDKSVCDALTERNASGYTVEQEQTVQTMVSSISAVKNVVTSLAPPALLLFLGSWSDRHKMRKPCIVLPIFGEVISCLMMVLNVYFFYELPMQATAYMEAVPASLCGGWFAMYMGSFSYVGEISDDKTRTVRVGALQIFMTISSTVGTALSGVLLKQVGFYGIYSLSAVLYLTGILYTLLCVKEEGALKQALNKSYCNKVGCEVTSDGDIDLKDEKPKSFLKDFFDLKHIKETLKTAVKDGERNRKKRVCLILVLVMVIIGPLHGEGGVYYLFLRYKFGWNEVDYSMYCTFYVLMNLAGTSFSLLVFSKYLKINDAMLGVISCTSKIISCFVYAFAPTGNFFYLGAIPELLSGVAFVSLRSIISKLVPSNELGKINSLFGLCEALMPLLYGPFYNLLYNWTIDKFPGTFLIMTGVLTTPALFIFYWLYTEHIRDLAEEVKIKEKEHETTTFLKVIN